MPPPPRLSTSYNTATFLHAINMATSSPVPAGTADSSSDSDSACSALLVAFKTLKTQLGKEASQSTLAEMHKITKGYTLESKKCPQGTVLLLYPKSAPSGRAGHSNSPLWASDDTSLCHPPASHGEVEVHLHQGGVMFVTHQRGTSAFPSTIIVPGAKTNTFASVPGTSADISRLSQMPDLLAKAAFGLVHLKHPDAQVTASNNAKTTASLQSSGDSTAMLKRHSPTGSDATL